MSNIVVSDTAAIIHLSKIDALPLLRSLYGEILIPQAVYDEITKMGEMRPGALQLMNASWIKVIQIKNPIIVVKLRAKLDLGESEAIALALETNADVLIIDEALGREIAKKLVKKIIGIVGILLEAKKVRLIKEINPYLLNLKETGFRISDALLRHALNEAGESQNQAKS